MRSYAPFALLHKHSECNFILQTVKHVLDASTELCLMFQHVHFLILYSLGILHIAFHNITHILFYLFI